MKTLFFTLSLLIISASAHAIPSLRCVTSGMPTTSFILEEIKDKVVLRVINHNGIKYAPVYSGIATLNDVDFIKKSAAFFTRIGEEFTIKFNKNKCSLKENKFYTCSLNEDINISGVKINSVYFTTSESVDKIPDFEFTRTNTYISLREGQDDYRLEMSYYNNDCQIQK